MSPNSHFFLYCHDLLSRWDIPCIPFKGPILAWQAYGDEMLRIFTDVDFLIQARDFPQAYELLLREGFMPEFNLDHRRMRLLLKGDTEVQFRRGGRFLELHWLVSEREDLFPLPERFFWENSAVDSAFGRQLRLLSPECTFLLSCLHGSKHLWSSLKWAVDLAFLSHKISPDGWSALQEWGRRWGFLRNILLGALLANALGGAAFPEQTEINRPDPLSQRMVNQVLDSWLHAPAEQDYWSNVLFYMTSRERIGDRVQYVVRKAFVYKKEDWLSLPLPRAGEFLYFLYRPVRIACLFGIPFLAKRFGSSLKLCR